MHNISSSLCRSAFAGYIHAILRPSQASGAAELLSMGGNEQDEEGRAHHSSKGEQGWWLSSAIGCINICYGRSKTPL